jgi:anti-sigma regulatory factor (Ser/Thr protein kinase)
MTSQVTLSVHYSDSDITRILSEADEWLREHHFNDELRKKILLCLDEVVINVLRYGFTDKEKCVFFITLYCDESKMIIRSRDTGRPFDPTRVPKPDVTSTLEERPIGGLGVHIIRSLMDSVEYTRNGNYNELTLTKRL